MVRNHEGYRGASRSGRSGSFPKYSFESLLGRVPRKTIFGRYRCHRDKSVYLGEFAEQAERYDEAVDCTKEDGEGSRELYLDELEERRWSAMAGGSGRAATCGLLPLLCDPRSTVPAGIIQMMICVCLATVVLRTCGNCVAILLRWTRLFRTC